MEIETGTLEQPPTDISDESSKKPDENVEGKKSGGDMLSFNRRILMLAQPKRDYYVPPRPMHTKYSRPGPMQEEDWQRFEEWAEMNAAPKKYPEPPPPADRIVIPLSKIKKRLGRLSTPTHRREKYVKPPEPVYNFRPRINNPSKKKEKPRILPPVVKKRCCYIVPPETPSVHVLPSALKYEPSENILKLARPRVLPQQREIRRKKMNLKQWVVHLWRLNRLAAPKPVRPLPPEKRPLPRKKVPLRKLKPRLQVLAAPRPEEKKEKEKIPGQVNPAALKVKSSPRTNQLAQPNQRRQKYVPRSEVKHYVKKSALKYKASERIKKLAEPRIYPEPPTEEELEKRRQELRQKYEDYDSWGFI